MEREKTTVYFVSGLSTNEKVFSHIKLPETFEKKFISWKLPHRGESLSRYSLRMAEEINQKKIGLIKIDVEGHEIKVLRGAANLIKKQKPVILFEQNAGEIKNGTSESIEFLKSCGYSFLVFSVKEPPIVFRWSRFLKFFYYFLCGQCLEIAEREYFEKANYAMIIAKP